MGSGVGGCQSSEQRRVRVVVVDADARVRPASRSAIDDEPDPEVTGVVVDADVAVPLVAAAAPCVALVDVTGPGTTAGIAALNRIAACHSPDMVKSLSAVPLTDRASVIAPTRTGHHADDVRGWLEVGWETQTRTDPKEYLRCPSTARRWWSEPPGVSVSPSPRNSSLGVGT